MSSHAQDQKTQAAASTGAQANDAQLAANAAKNQQFSDQTRTTLFGTYNPTTNQYEGGTESKFLDPSSLDTKDLTGAYANEYNTISNQNAKNAQDAVGTTMQNLASRGLGKTPAGFAADQQRKAYQDQTDSNASAYSGLFSQQHGEAVDQYKNANNMLTNNSQGAANLSLQGNTNAAGNYNGLYGTASQQVQNPWMNAAGAVAGLGQAASGFMPKPGCWIAAELYGGWFEPRTMLIREWLHEEVSKSLVGRSIIALYMRFGPRIAELIKTKRILRRVCQSIFDAALSRARRWKEGR